MANQSKFTAVQTDSGTSRPPTLTSGDMNPALMCSFENACLGYFEHKEIEADKQVCKILACLQDSHVQGWISVDHDHFLALSFADFMTKFCAVYLPKDWEEITHIELLGMTQGNLAFRDFSIDVQSKNALLRNTPSYLTKELLHHHIESRMNQKLALRCRLEKISLIEKFKQWLTEVKHVDDLVCLENKNFETLTRATREATRRNNTLVELSRGANSSYKAPLFVSDASTRNSLPKISNSKCKLLYDNKGCLKCRCVFVTHRSTTCPNDFPDPTMYRPLTQATVDAVAKRVKKNVASIVPFTEPAAGLSNVQVCMMYRVYGFRRRFTLLFPPRYVHL
jgi:hypothetical protein